MIRSAISAIVFLLAASFSSASLAQTDVDRQAVQTLVADQYRYFGERQAVAYGDLFTPTATFITAEGMKMDGRAEIVESNAFFFGMVDVEKNNVTFKNLTINFINPDTAVTYSVWDGLWTKPAINDRAQSGYLTMVVQRVEGRWLIASATNAFNWRGTPNYDLTEFDVLRARMAARAAPRN